MNFTKDRLEFLLSLSIDEAVTSHTREVVAYYAYLFNDPNACASCMNKIRGYYQQLQQKGIQKLEEKMAKKQQKTTEKVVENPTTVSEDVAKVVGEAIQGKKKSQFKIKSDISFLQVAFGSSKVFNNDTITDELAIEYLKGNPKRIINFVKYPENWEELIEK